MLRLQSLRSGFLGGLSDQALVSLGNFGLNVALARRLAEHDYGAFSLILYAALFLNTLHQAFVSFPLSVRGAPAAPAKFSYFLAVAAAFTLIEAILFFPIMGGAAASMGHPSLFLPACLFLLSWQLQEIYRRGLLARARYGAAIANDIVRYILPLAAIMAFGWWAPPSLQEIFFLLSLASLLAAIPLVPMLAGQYRAVRDNMKTELREHWQMAAPFLFANILAALSNQWFVWLLAWNRDLTSSGTMVALSNIVAFSQPVMFGMENILVPEIARRRHALSFDDLRMLLRRRGLACGALLAPFFLAIFVWPDATLHLVYGAHKSFAHYTLALRLLVFAYMAQLAGFIFSATLRGYRNTAAVFHMQLYPALLGVTLGSWLILRFGITGACCAALLCSLLRAAIGYYFVNRLRELTTSGTDEIFIP